MICVKYYLKFHRCTYKCTRFTQMLRLFTVSLWFAIAVLSGFSGQKQASGKSDSGFTLDQFTIVPGGQFTRENAFEQFSEEIQALSPGCSFISAIDFAPINPSFKFLIPEHDSFEEVPPTGPPLFLKNRTLLI